LGYGLAQQRQWAEALVAQQRCCGLLPQLADAWYEQGRVALELGQDALARAALERAVALRPDWDAAQALLQGARVRLALQESVAAAAAGIRAVIQAAQPPEWLLIEWCELAAAQQLAAEWSDARLLWQVLAEDAPVVEACSHPFPRRLARTALLILELLKPTDPPRAAQLAGALRGCLWLPPSTAEQGFWTRFVEPALWMLPARLTAPLERDVAPLGRLLLDALPAIEPPGQPSARLYRALAQRLPPESPQGFLALQGRLGFGQPDPGSLDWLPDLLSAAAARLRQAPSDGVVRRLVDQHLQALSELMLDRPNRLVALPGQLDRAQALRRQALEALVQADQAFAALDGQSPAPPRRGRRRRWLLLASHDLPQCVLYRVEHKRQQLERLGCRVRILWREQLESWAFTEELLNADAVVVCRLPGTHTVLRAMAAARRFGLPVFYDIDDLLFDPQHCPPDLATYGGTLRPELHRRFALDVPLFSLVMQQADGLILSTPTLARRWRELFPQDRRPVWVLPNLAPAELLAAATPPRVDQPEPLEALRLVFASGTTAHKQAWQEELAPALAAVLARHPRLRLDLLGHVRLPQVLLPFRDRISCRPYAAYGTYLRQLSRSQIGLVVLEPGTYTDAKSAIRWMEFSLLGLAAVLSPTATYTELLTAGEHVLFARGPQQWEQAVQRLIDDPDLRLRLAHQAHRKALQLFSPQRADSIWEDLIAAPAASPRRRRLLVINVFFAPQSIGGATRVAQDQVLQLLERAGDRYEVTVLCADHGPWQNDSADADNAVRLAVDSHSWHGARVVRLALPPRPWRQAEDPVVAEFCRRWFVDEGFDLIHAHCLQMLTVTPLQVAAELGIPYLITLHDGWWLSPRLFLTTVSGRAIDPADPIGHYDDPAAQASDDLQADRRRRVLLQGVLAGAAARLAVSEAFAAVYRRGGVEDVSVVENDWQPMALAPRRVRPRQQPLRLCYVGGMALHKGYAVLQAALLRHSLADAGAGAELTVIDATLQPHHTYTRLWNGTPVHGRASVPMAEMAAFYADQDVLIAPSIWPESYGLVTREALSAGLWVVASDIGALADPIQPGVNGHVVPPGDPDVLGAVLQQLCRVHPQPRPLLQFTGSRSAIDSLLPLYERCSS
jgi:glycosyltransferase involved in cell wall biosynthesis